MLANVSRIQWGQHTIYHGNDPLFTNYSNLLGKLLTKAGLLALFKFVICFVPLIVAAQVNKYYDRKLTRPISGIADVDPWISGNHTRFLVDQCKRMQSTTLQADSDFFIVVFRTILFVIITIPINYIVGLALALVLNTEYHQGTDILPHRDDHSLGSFNDVHHHVVGMAVLLSGCWA